MIARHERKALVHSKVPLGVSMPNASIPSALDAPVVASTQVAETNGALRRRHYQLSLEDGVVGVTAAVYILRGTRPLDNNEAKRKPLCLHNSNIRVTS